MRKSSMSVLWLLLSLCLLQGCAGGLFAAASVGTVTAIHDRRTLGTQLDDQTIELKAAAAITEHKQLNEQTHIRVFCYNGEVLLVGQIPTSHLHSEAMRIIEGISGIKRIHNEIQMKDVTSLKIRANDTWITTKINGSMLANETLDPTRIKVVTEDSKVYLLGLVTKAEAELATEIARNTKGVGEVITVFRYL